MKNKIFLIFALALVTLASCKESFFDINDNPNNPTREAVEPRLFLPMVLSATAKKMAVDYRTQAHWMGYWARGGSFGPSIPLENYDITSSFEQNQWVNGNTTVANPLIGWYDIIKDADEMELKAVELNQPFYAGAAKVIKAIGYMYLVDMYGNVPYSEALKIEQFIAPKYDNGQDIYNDLLIQLDTANVIFQSDLEITPALRSADVMFQGNTTMWRKLVNTQKLKLLIHMSEVLPAAPTAEIAKILADGSGFLMSGETAEVQPGYGINAYQLNPFYNAFLMDENNNRIDDFNRASNYLLNKYFDNNDPRYQYVFSEAVNPLNPDPADPKTIYVGATFGAPNAAGVVSQNQSDVAGPGLAKSPTQPQWLFTSVESMFLQAEATQRGWLPGSPGAAYRAAVTESFIWLGVTNATASAAAYLDQGNAISNWSANTDKIKLIGTQKYLALAGINNFEAWVDYRRIGVPADVPLSLNGTIGTRRIPVRLLYPQNEFSYNAANVTAQGDIDPQTSKVFWDK